MGLNYIDLFDRAAVIAKDRVALADDDDSLTYAELQAFGNRLARQLLAEGFARSTPYGVLSPNSAKAMAALLGGLRAGGAWCNINLRNALALNIDVLRRGGVELVFFHSSLAPVMAQVKAEVPSLKWILCLDRDVEGFPSVETFCRGASAEHVVVRLAENETGMQGTTGGTTGAPKIVRHGPGFLAMNALAFMQCLAGPEPPVNLAVAPITHAGGIVAQACLALGGTVHMMPAVDLEKLLAKIEQRKISLLFLPPTVIYTLLNHPRTATTDFSSLRLLMSAAAPLSIEKIALAVKTIGPVIGQSYGQTETGFPLTFMPPSIVNEALADATKAKRLASAGWMTPNIGRLEILNDDGTILPVGESGEIAVQGPTVMLEYVDDPAATAAIRVDGWQRTGDIGHRDEDGFVYVSDRKRDLIISGGFNVFPLQVEQVLCRHAAVQDVAVIGIPDDKWGEAVKAVVETAPGHTVTEAELIAFCREALGAVMTPKSVDFVPQLPRSAVGKVLKRELREKYWAGRKERI